MEFWPLSHPLPVFSLFGQFSSANEESRPAQEQILPAQDQEPNLTPGHFDSNSCLGHQLFSQLDLSSNMTQQNTRGWMCLSQNSICFLIVTLLMVVGQVMLRKAK